VGCCEEGDFTACVGEWALLGALGHWIDDNNTARGCRAEESLRASVQLRESESKGRGAGVRESQRLSFVHRAGLASRGRPER
jgi:hypothetical protein